MCASRYRCGWVFLRFPIPFSQTICSTPQAWISKINGMTVTGRGQFFFLLSSHHPRTFFPQPAKVQGMPRNVREVDWMKKGLPGFPPGFGSRWDDWLQRCKDLVWLRWEGWPIVAAWVSVADHRAVRAAATLSWRMAGACLALARAKLLMKASPLSTKGFGCWGSAMPTPRNRGPRRGCRWCRTSFHLQLWWPCCHIVTTPAKTPHGSICEIWCFEMFLRWICWICLSFCLRKKLRKKNWRILATRETSTSFNLSMFAGQRVQAWTNLRCGYFVRKCSGYFVSSGRTVSFSDLATWQASPKFRRNLSCWTTAR